MGNSQYRQEELAPYQPDLTNYTLVQAYNPLSIYQHLYNGQQIMQYSEMIYHSQDIDRKLQTFLARYQHLYLVSTVYLQLEGSNTCNDGSFSVKTFYQRVITNLSKINDLPFNDSLHCFAVALRGFELLYKSYGYFQVFQNMFHICQRGKLKVWCNQLIYKSVPEQYLLGNGRQEDMVMKIISIIDENTEPSSKQVPIKDILIKTNSLNFTSANAKFKQICRENKLYVSQYLLSLQNSPHFETILDIYAPRKYEVNSIKHFDTGLTFNPNKFKVNKESTGSSHNNSAIKNSNDVSLRNNILIPNQRGRSSDSPYNANKSSRKVDLTMNRLTNPGQTSKLAFKKLDSSRKRTDSRQMAPRSNSADNYPRPHLSSTINQVNISHLSKQMNQGNLNLFKKPSSNYVGNLLKKSSRPEDKSSYKILYESSVNSQNQQKFSPYQPNINLFDHNRNPIPREIIFNTIINNANQPQIIGRQSRLIQNGVIPQQRPSVRAYSQNHNRQPQPLTASRARTFVTSPPSPTINNYQQPRPYIIQTTPMNQNHQQMSFTNNKLQFQQKGNAQVIPIAQNQPIHQDNMIHQGQVYPIYPIQKIIIGQDQASTLKKTIKFKPAFETNSVQSSKEPIHTNIKQINFTNHFVSHANQAPQQQLIHSNVQSQLYTYNTPQNAHLKSNQQRQNNHLNTSQFSQQQVSMQMSPNIIKRYQTLPNQLSFHVNTLERSKMDESPLLSKYTPFKGQKYQNSYQKQANNDKLFTLGNISNQKMQVQRQNNNDKFQLPQLQSKIMLLQSFAQNKINTHQFLVNQSHALSNVKWQKSSNSGRDSITSAFRKELLLQNSYKPSEKRSYLAEGKKDEVKIERQSSFLTRFDYDHLQTDPKLLDMIKSVSKDYKKQLSKTTMLENKFSKISTQYTKKDAVKQQYNNIDKYSTNNYTQSRFKKLSINQKQQKYSNPQFLDSFGKSNFQKGRVQQSNNFFDSASFKKKAEPYLSNKFSAISEKQEQENVCSTSNGSMGGKNYLQNLDIDILQDMAAYGMECTKGKPRSK